MDDTDTGPFDGERPHGVELQGPEPSEAARKRGYRLGDDDGTPADQRTRSVVAATEPDDRRVVSPFPATATPRDIDARRLSWAVDAVPMGPVEQLELCAAKCHRRTELDRRPFADVVIEIGGELRSPYQIADHTVHNLTGVDEAALGEASDLAGEFGLAVLDADADTGWATIGRPDTTPAEEADVAVAILDRVYDASVADLRGFEIADNW